MPVWAFGDAARDKLLTQMARGFWTLTLRVGAVTPRPNRKPFKTRQIRYRLQFRIEHTSAPVNDPPRTATFGDRLRASLPVTQVPERRVGISTPAELGTLTG
jgi:hypothetical protein